MNNKCITCLPELSNKELLPQPAAMNTLREATAFSDSNLQGLMQIQPRPQTVKKNLFIPKTFFVLEWMQILAYFKRKISLLRFPTVFETKIKNVKTEIYQKRYFSNFI